MDINVRKIWLTHDGWAFSEHGYSVYGFPSAQAALDYAQGKQDDNTLRTNLPAGLTGPFHWETRTLGI